MAGPEGKEISKTISTHAHTFFLMGVLNGPIVLERPFVHGVLSCHLAPSGAPRLVHLRLISLPSGNAVTLFNDMTPRTGDSATCTHTPCPPAQLPGAVSCWEDDITLPARALSWRKIGMSPGWAGGLSGQGPALELSCQSSLASPTGQDPKNGFPSPRSIIHESKMM